MDKTEVIELVRIYKKLLKKHFGPVDVYLFGSYANNSFKNDSDIDVAVVFENIEGDFFDINPVLWRLRRQVDDRIEPVLIEKDHDESGFLEEIMKTGVAIE
jgi:predicted nucleotidyltransferase